jgi:hypothetical protein
MKDNKNSPHKSGGLVDKIENQLQDILTKKKEEIERSLEERIRQERDDAQRKLAEIEQDYESEKESLINYKAKFSEIETRRDEIRSRIKTHLDLAVSYQTEISGLTGKTLDELKKVGELNQKLDDYQKQAESELTDMKKDLESKYGIIAAFPESKGHEDVDFNLEQELSKLKKIKELLGSRGEDTEKVDVPPFPDEPVQDRTVDAEPEDEAPVPFEEKDEEQEIESVEEPSATPEEPAEAAPVEADYELRLPETIDPVLEPEEIKRPEEPQIDVQTPFVTQPEVEFESFEENDDADLRHPAFDASLSDSPSGAEEISFSPVESQESGMEPVVPQTQAPAPEDKPTPLVEREQAPPLEANFQDVFEKLEQYRKGSCSEDNGDVSYFQAEDKIILDGECLVSSLTNSLDGAKNLYKKLNDTESPKEQFFIKQDIIRYQEVLRKLMLSSIKMCEKETCALPRYTREILHVEVLKTILEKVSMENWSDEQDFLEFDKYAKSLKDAYYARITPPARYIQSILDELEK